MKRLLIIAAVVVAALSGCENIRFNRYVESDLKDSLLVNYMRYVSQFSDCSFADWEGFSKMRIRQYPADWDEAMDDKIHPSWRQEGLDAGAWAILQNAKAEVHRRSIPLRTLASRALCKRMDALERSFDEAFEQMVTQEYYLRCFEDVFDETVPPRVEGLYK